MKCLERNTVCAFPGHWSSPAWRVSKVDNFQIFQTVPKSQVSSIAVIYVVSDTTLHAVKPSRLDLPSVACRLPNKWNQPRYVWVIKQDQKASWWLSWQLCVTLGVLNFGKQLHHWLGPQEAHGQCKLESRAGYFGSASSLQHSTKQGLTKDAFQYCQVIHFFHKKKKKPSSGPE